MYIKLEGAIKMKKLLFILILCIFASCENGPLKTYRVAITNVNDKCDTVNYYFHDENYEIDNYGDMLKLRNGCLCKQYGASSLKEIVCGVKSYKLISISTTPKSVEIEAVKSDKYLDKK